MNIPRVSPDRGVVTLAREEAAYPQHQQMKMIEFAVVTRSGMVFR